MADITVNSTKIAPANAFDCVLRNGIAGAAVTVGYLAYADTDSYWQHSEADNLVAVAEGVGIIVASFDGETSIASGRGLTVCLHGPVEGFSGMTPGAPVYNSKTVGRLSHTKPSSGAFPRAIGYALTATCLMVAPEVTAPTSD